MPSWLSARVRRSSRIAPWTDAEAARVLASAQSSGQSLYKFARDHGLSTTQLYWWRDRLAKRLPARHATQPTFVPVVAAEPPAVSCASGLELAVGRVTVRISTDFCAATLERLLPILVEMPSC